MTVLHALTVALLTIAISAYVTQRAMEWSRRNNLLDVPNARSSHTAPTPRGGGLGIILAFAVALVIMTATGKVSSHVAGALGCGYLVALVGYVDDLRPLSVRLRLAVHALAAASALAILWPLPKIIFLRLEFPTEASGVIYFLMIVWLTNLYNFMDGIDGLAGANAVAVCGVWVVLTGADVTAYLPLTLGAACLGFLRYNWPPARVFMGDVGSSFLGFAFAVSAIGLAELTATSVFLWLIPLSTFIADATGTLLIRALHGNSIGVAHRSHVYQRLSRRFGQHLRVSLLYSAFTAMVLGGIAIFSNWMGFQPMEMFIVTALALVAVAIRLGAGRPDVG